jgi:hypothetical protein
MLETFVINPSRKGTILRSFTNVEGLDSEFDSAPMSYLVLDLANYPQRIVQSIFDATYNRTPDNNFLYDKNFRYVTGKTVTEVFNYVLTDAQKSKAKLQLQESAVSFSGNNAVTFIEFEDTLIDDYYATLSVDRQINTLDTLSVHNAIVGETPAKESTTGVLFGKLEAIQKINDENGNKIRIPLANVIVGIFNPSEDFPSVASTDEDGNRIALNVKENCFKDLYFNNQCFSADTEILLSDSRHRDISDQYKYTTITNENGEFILQNIPTGEQVFMLEVDLLKQGLTKDEVALNYFPYPTEENPNLDNIPHLYFRQIPVNIVPSWGDSQSGYTELNITIPVDLRKWTTYMFPPVAIGGKKLEESVAISSQNSLKVQIMDMTLENFPFKTYKMSQIENDLLDRDNSQQFSWLNEFPQRKRQGEFTKFGCNILKLPANLYDPNGFKTDVNGNPTNQKGVWLSSYQFKMFCSNAVTRRTGAIRAFDGNNEYLLSHFDINYTETSPKQTDTPRMIGTFPYEQQWTINYPEKYSIPKKPTKERYNGNFNSQRQVYTTLGSNKVYYLNEPVYEDGDLVGQVVSEDTAGGFGIQTLGGVWFANRIGQVISKSLLYKYEKGVAYNEKYANDYEPFWDASSGKLFGGESNVVGGEKYQRLECGYGYFMKPEGWNVIVRQSWGADTPRAQDIIASGGDTGLRSYGDTNNPGPGTSPSGIVGLFYSPTSHRNDVYNLDNQNLALCMDIRSKIRNGTIDIYRVIESGSVESLAERRSFVIPTYIKLVSEGLSDRIVEFFIRNDGDEISKITNTLLTEVKYEDKNGVIQTAPIGSSFELYVGKSFGTSFRESQKFYDVNSYNDNLYPNPWVNYSDFLKHKIRTVDNTMQIQLQGNSNFNPETNKFENAVYTIGATYSNFDDKSRPKESLITLQVTMSPTAKVDPPFFFIKTEHDGGDHGRVSNGFSTYYGGEPLAKAARILIEQDNSQRDE